MRIRIEHTSNPLNYGTSMMVINFMYYIDKELGEIEYYLDVNNNGDLNRYKEQYNSNIFRETIDYNVCIWNNQFERIMNKIKRKIAFNKFSEKALKKLKKDTDTLIILGGDDLSEYYGVSGLERELNRLNSIKENINVFLVGQTIGPFSKERFNLVKNSFKDLKIYTRDDLSKRYLEKNLDIINIKKSADLAFLPLPGQDNNVKEAEILNKYSLHSDEYITIVPSGLYNSYCSDKKLYISEWKKIIEEVRNNNPNKKIVLLPHVLVKSNDDRNIILSLKNNIENKKNIIFILDEMQPLEARFILGNGKLTISGRMHSAISTFQMRKPAISISYSIKYNGVIGEGLGLKELIIDGSNINEWYKNNISKNILNKIQYVYDNYDKLIYEINKSVNRCELEAKNMIKDIADNLINKGE